MSMYSELLSVLYVGVDPNDMPASHEELVVILLQCRRRLKQRSPALEHNIAEDLAIELDHDRMLLQLCSAMGIEHDPGRFEYPIAERRRLEEALRRRGVEFRPTDHDEGKGSDVPCAEVAL
jgi:hypothetical protein